jgi:hypothetical protein
LPFSSANLTALIQGNAFTLWQYRTTDARAVVSAADYFAPVASALRPGDLMVLQAADSLALLPIRSGPALGTGVTLDGAVGPLNTVRSIAQSFSLAQAAAAVVRTIVLLPLGVAIAAGGSVPVTANVTGQVAQVVFTLLDANGAVIPPVQTVAVSNGSASTSFAAPPVGNGYRIRAEDAADPAVGVTGPSFSVGADTALLRTQDGSLLLQENGSALKI